MEIKGSDIREARKRAGLTQESLADATEFSSRQISRFESDENLMKLNKYYKLFKMLFTNNEEK